MQDLLVGSSAVHSNGRVADERLFRGFGSRSCEIRGVCWRSGLRLLRFGN